MQQHPRESVVALAEAELAMAFSRIVEEHNLTHGEISALLASLLLRRSRCQICDERNAAAAPAQAL